MLATVNELLSDEGLLLKAGTAVDATLIAAPSSTKNKAKKRDPEMHSSQKGNAWHFGMKAHIGVDIHSGLVHTVRGTSGNVADIAEGHRACCTGKRPACMRMLVTRAHKNDPTPERGWTGTWPCARASA